MQLALTLASRRMLASALLGFLFTAQASAAEPWKPAGLLAKVSFERDGALILIPVYVNGKQHEFLIDTNCTATLLDSTLTADLRHLSTDPVGTEEKDIQVPKYSAPRLAIADLACEWITEVGAIDLGPFRTAVGKDFHGVIGMDVLRRHLLHIDFDNGLLLVCDPKVEHSPPGAPTPLLLDDQLCPKILARPRGADACVFRIDTGMNGNGHFDQDTMDAMERAKAIANVGITHKFLSADRSVVTKPLVRCLEIDVAGHSLSNLIFAPSATNVFGLKFLRRHRVTLDFVNGQAFFEPGETHSFRDRSDYEGLVVDKQFVVRHVVPGSVADRAGLQVSDQLTAVDGTKVGSVPWPKINCLLTTPRATELTVTAVRDGREVAIKIPGG